MGIALFPTRNNQLYMKRDICTILIIAPENKKNEYCISKINTHTHTHTAVHVQILLHSNIPGSVRLNCSPCAQGHPSTPEHRSYLQERAMWSPLSTVNQEPQFLSQRIGGEHSIKLKGYNSRGVGLRETRPRGFQVVL